MGFTGIYTNHRLEVIGGDEAFISVHFWTIKCFSGAHSLAITHLGF